MAWEEVSVDGVDYVLFRGVHCASSAGMIENAGGFGGFDALVLETCSDTEGVYCEGWGLNHPQYAAIHDELLHSARHVRLYDVDVSPNFISAFSVGEQDRFIDSVGGTAGMLGGVMDMRHSTSRRGFLRGMVIFAAGFAMPFNGLFDGLYNGEDPQVLSELRSLKQHIFPATAMSFRDAVVAKKLKGWVAPEEKQFCERPRIGVVFGANHTSIEEKLEDNVLCDRTIRHVLERNVGDVSCGALLSHLNRAAKIRRNGGEYGVEELSLSLF